MIRKERVLPPRIEKEEALLRRLPKNHKKWREILRNLTKVSTGFKGEHELDYHLEFLPDEDFDILCDLRIPLDHRTFQMDTLVLSPHFPLIIESKNIFGTLLFDDISKQLFRTFEGKREGFANPIQQAKRQQILFERWLKRHLLKTIPVYHLVSIDLPSTIIETTAKNAELFNKVLHAEHIPDKILSLVQSHQNKNLTPYQQRKIITLLLEQHTPTPSSRGREKARIFS